MIQPESKSNIYFANLDGLRSIAFASVFLWHISSYIGYSPSSGLESIFLKRVCSQGHLGVNLFFVLSGFLITYLLILEKEKNGRIQIFRFYIRRILRIWPLYFLVVGLGLFCIPMLLHQFHWAQVKEHGLSFLFFINNFNRIQTGFVGIGNDSLGVLWSIAVEEQFYFFLPLLLALLNRKWLPFLFLITILLSIVFRTANIAESSKLYLHTFSVMSDLAIGGILAYLACFSSGFISFLKRMPRFVIITIYLFSLVFICFFSYRINFLLYHIFERLLLSLFFVFVIAEQCYSDHSFFKFRNSKVLSRTGLITYGLYCLHLYSIMIIQKINTYWGISHLSSFLFYSEFLVCLILSVLIAKLSYTYFEMYFLTLKNKFNS
jgi:peptidoglycan/LPS O-acetylase OafA/YrhL